MRYLNFLPMSGLMALWLLAGCATHRQSAEVVPQTDRRVYNGTFDQLWRASLDAAQRSDLEITSANRASGYIGARRPGSPDAYGDDVGVWVRRVGPAQTEVEVENRRGTPPPLALRTWQQGIHRTVAADLANGTPPVGVGAAPGQTVITRGGSTVIIPPSSQPTVVVPSAPAYDSVADQQRRIEALRKEILDRRTALSVESDSARRDAIEREIDRLNTDLAIEEQRLRGYR